MPSVYRILKLHGLVAPAQVEVVQAAAEFRRKTTRVHELWQTDLTYFFVHGWGWYYVGGILDDYSRYLLAYQVAAAMPFLASVLLWWVLTSEAWYFVDWGLKAGEDAQQYALLLRLAAFRRGD